MKFESKNPNYSAYIFMLSNLRKHSNADRLQCASVVFNNVITSLSAKNGDYYIYFPVECAIHKDFLKFTNSFANPELNTDPAVKGYFDKNGRVRAVTLRGEKSAGYIIPVSEFVRWLNTMNAFKDVTEKDFIQKCDTNFDVLTSGTSSLKACQKYIVVLNNPSTSAKTRNVKKDKRKRFTRVIDEQFRLGKDVPNLRKTIYQFSPDDLIGITYKMHGTSATIGNVIINKRLTILQAIAKRLGIPVKDTEYGLVYASRRVIKNKFLYTGDVGAKHFYTEDVWGEIASKLYKEEKIEYGVTLYGEIVGQTKEGKYIQKPYDYGVNDKTIDFFVFRVTYTTPQGKTIEFSTPQIQDYCRRHNLKMVPVFYVGLAKDLFDISETEHWHENFLNALIEKYNDKDCFMCKNVVPEEGIILRKEIGDWDGGKLKSFRFLEHESKALDSGEVDIADADADVNETETETV